MKRKFAVISLSGGMDSSTLLLRLLREGYDVTALSFDYGQKHKVELEKATELVEYINHSMWDNRGKQNPEISYTPNLYDVGKFEPFIKHQIIKLDGLSKLLNSSLVEGGSEVPEGHYEQDNMKDTVVPNRNKIFSSIIQAVALSIAEKNQTECFISLGIHAGDHSIYPDCRQEFRDADHEAFVVGNWGAEKVKFYTPYLLENKFTILQDGEKSCKELSLNFDEVYSRTLTSYKPICLMENRGVTVKDNTTEIIYIKKWYSDYKSASSVERIEAFIKLSRPDSAPYADETGPVSWEVAKSHVEKILAEHK